MTFVDYLKIACEEISSDYFLLPIAGRDRPIKRERVYCYELYHQLRVALGGSQLTLTGEPDKSGHPSFGKGRQLNPDFILHSPGNHGNNSAAVEVECRVSLEHLTKDLRNLQVMKSKGYEELVLLLFAITEVPWRKLGIAASEVDMNLEEIKVLLHKDVGTPAVLSQPPVLAVT